MKLSLLIGGRDESLIHLISEEYESSYEDVNHGSSIIFDSNIKFCENSTTWRGGAIQSDNSSMTIDGEVEFKNNTVFHGGGIFLARTKLILSPTAMVSFIQNHANSRGGAIYVKDSCYFGSIECFLSIETDLNRASTKKLLFFNSNSAKSNSSNLYGGQLNKCRFNNINYYGTKFSDDALGIFMNISMIHNESKSFTNISSQAYQIKFCKGDKPLNNPPNYKNLELHQERNSILQ